MKELIATTLSLALISAVSANAVSALTQPTKAQEDVPPVISEQAGVYHISVNGEDLTLAAESKLNAEKERCITVPLRSVAETLGFAVEWLDGMVRIEGHDVFTTVTLGEDLYFITTTMENADGTSAPFSLGVAPYIKDGSTYVPVELFVALLGNNEELLQIEGNRIFIQSESISFDRIPNPLFDFESLEDAEQFVGFSFTVPDNISGYSIREIQTIDEDLIQVFYRDDEAWLLIRKGIGTGDISGDYNDYQDVRTVTVGDVPVQLRGENGEVLVATWNDGTYAYSVSVSDGMSDDALLAIVQQVK